MEIVPSLTLSLLSDSDTFVKSSSSLSDDHSPASCRRLISDFVRSAETFAAWRCGRLLVVVDDTGVDTVADLETAAFGAEAFFEEETLEAFDDAFLAAAATILFDVVDDDVFAFLAGGCEVLFADLAGILTCV